MGNVSSVYRCNFETIQEMIKANSRDIILINTLDRNNQSCLIQGTLSVGDEIKVIDESLRKRQKKTIYIYGKNYNDETVYKKYEQLSKISQFKCYIYLGGLFEWLLLQEIYGGSLFPTNGLEQDLLKYK
tara:strand:- start:1115 stop:1501 length:387 start_codon:yes stop_codon:yes gene_type:complete